MNGKLRFIEAMHKTANKSGIFNINPEFFHHTFMNISKHAENSEYIINLIKETFYLEDPKLKTKIGNLELKNPVGLAAGMIKEPDGLKFWEAFGFGYCEELQWTNNHEIPSLDYLDILNRILG